MTSSVCDFKLSVVHFEIETFYIWMKWKKKCHIFTKSLHSPPPNKHLHIIHKHKTKFPQVKFFYSANTPCIYSFCNSLYKYIEFVIAFFHFPVRSLEFSPILDWKYLEGMWRLSEFIPPGCKTTHTKTWTDQLKNKSKLSVMLNKAYTYICTISCIPPEKKQPRVAPYAIRWSILSIII